MVGQAKIGGPYIRQRYPMNILDPAFEDRIYRTIQLMA
jgi:hypothetical protein